MQLVKIALSSLSLKKTQNPRNRKVLRFMLLEFFILDWQALHDEELWK